MFTLAALANTCDRIRLLAYANINLLLFECFALLISRHIRCWPMSTSCCHWISIGRFSCAFSLFLCFQLRCRLHKSIEIDYISIDWDRFFFQIVEANERVRMRGGDFQRACINSVCGKSKYWRSLKCMHLLSSPLLMLLSIQLPTKCKFQERMSERSRECETKAS